MSKVNKGNLSEVLELMEYVLNNNSYLRGKINKKEVGSSVNKESIEKSIKEVSDKNVKEILKKELGNFDKKRGNELGKRYGKLLFSDNVLEKMGWKKKV
jgi:hypothetical protein